MRQVSMSVFLNRGADTPTTLLALFAILWLSTNFSYAQNIPILPPNIQYVTYGYDAVQGNPQNGQGDSADPGFKIKYRIFKIQYTKNASSDDNYYNKPDYIDVIRTPICSYNAAVVEISSAYEYQRWLSNDVTVSGERLPIAFSGSAAYQEVTDRIQTESRSYIFTKTKCATYTAKINAFSNIQPSDEFVSAINQLPMGNDRSKYFQLFDIFGTHYIASVDMGATVVAQTTIEQTTMSQLIQCGLDVSALASLILPTFYGAINIDNSKQVALRTTFNKHRGSVSIYYQGSLANNTTRFDLWSQGVGDNPFPVSYQLRPLTDLVAANFFPSLSAWELSYKNKMMMDSLNEYCTYLDVSCAGPAQINPTKKPTDPSICDTDAIVKGNSSQNAVIGISVGFGVLLLSYQLLFYAY